MPPQLPPYSFKDVNATLAGVGGNISLGAGAGAHEEGITIEWLEETDTMIIGADGSTAHSLHASKAAKITVRLVKSSLTNGKLHSMYNQQREDTTAFGNNTLVIVNTLNGEGYSCQQVAFAKAPANTYAKTQGMVDWEFNAGQCDAILAGGN